MRAHTISMLLLAVWIAGCGGNGGSSATTPPTGGGGGPGGSTPSAAVTLPPDLDQGPRAGESAIDETMVAAGEKLFQTKGCSACHAFGKRVSCPDLDGVTTRRTAKWFQT